MGIRKEEQPIDDDIEDLPNLLSAVDSRAAQESHLQKNLWKLNYHEASIFIEEGLNNDKFENHPRNYSSTTRDGVSSSSNFNGASTLPPVTGTESDAPLLQAPISSTAGATIVEILNPDVKGATELIPLNKSSASQEKTAQQQAPLLAEVQRHKPVPWVRHKLLGGQYTTIETYILVHNKYFYQLDLIASIVLLLLAVVEPPAVAGLEFRPSVHASIEMFALAIVGIELLLKFRWMGPRQFFRHSRTVTKLVVLLTMIAEAIIIFMRYSAHVRYSRALRPIFLIDNHYCHGIRRAIRQIFQSLPPILDMFTLMMFFMFIFSIFGFYFLANDSPYFSNMASTVGNLLLLVTTANFPDVMMPSYSQSRWSSLFFVLFLIVHLFLLTNLTMAAVYESFTRKEKEKFHKLLLHRRKACQQAFKLLVSRRVPHRIQFKQFQGLMRYLNPHCSSFDAFLVFKALDTDGSGQLSLQEFYQIYDFIDLDWRLKYPRITWYDQCDCIPGFVKTQLDNIRVVVEHRYFDWAINVLIATSALLQFLEASARTKTTVESITPTTTTMNPTTANLFEQQSLFEKPRTIGLMQAEVTPDFISTSVFIGIFSAEIMLRACALGCQEYLMNYWNRFDLVVITTSILGIFTGYVGHHLGWLIVLRVIRLMRLFEFKRRYWDIWQTLTYILMKRFVSMTCVVMIMYYFFGIIGMELFASYDLRNCCKNTSLESQFRYVEPIISSTGGAAVSGDSNQQGAPNSYYLNDFADVVASYLTLFSMTSSTYWLVTMNAYAIVVGTNWVRLYFAIYYLCSIIVMNIVIAFILESFLFRIHYRRKLGDACDDANLFTVDVILSRAEMDYANRMLKNKKLDNVNRRLNSGTSIADQFANHHHIKVNIDNQNYYGYQQQEPPSTITSTTNNNNNNVDSVKQQQQTKQTTTANKMQRTRAPSLTSSMCHTSYASTNCITNSGGSAASGSGSSISSAPSPFGPSNQHSHLPHNIKGLLDGKQQHEPMDTQITPTMPTSATANVSRLIRESEKLRQSNEPSGFVLMYQAEQTRNKFSFTMKMYADEVKEWLEEADKADREELARQRLLKMSDIHLHFTPRRTYSCSY